jgi:hypothetical protein
MKKHLFVIGCAILATTGLVTADPTYTTSTPKNGPYIATKHPKLAPDLHVRPTGVLIDTAKYGLEMLSPVASPDLGYGEKYAAYPTGSVGGYHEASGYGAREDRSQDGIKVFGFEF